MNLRQLQTFVIVADTGSFAQALSRLHLSQPAASRQIHSLESELGVVLFDRVARGMQLTPAGEDLLRHSRVVLSGAEGIHLRARALKGGGTGLLKLGATPQVIENLLAAFLPEYARAFPLVEVELVEDGGARLPMRLERGDVHFAVMPTGDDRFDGRLLYPMHVFVAMSKTHGLSRRAVIDVKELAQERLMVGSGFASRIWFEAACQLAHVAPRIVLESAAPHTLIALAKSGYGVAILPSPALIPGDDICTAPLVHRGASIGRWARVAWNPERVLAPFAQRFVSALAAYCAKNVPGQKLLRRAPALPRPKDSARTDREAGLPD